MRRNVLGLVLGVLAAMALVAPVGAGGWAITTLDAVPDEVTAGEDVTIGFTVLQHGQTPAVLDETWIEIRSPETGETLLFAGAPSGTQGHYVATVRFPHAGAWEWSVIQGWFGPQALGTLQVAAPVAAGSSASAGESALRLALPLATLTLGALFVLQLALLRQASRGATPAPAAGD